MFDDNENLTLGGGARIILGNTYATIEGDIPLAKLDDACKFINPEAAKILRSENFDPNKNRLLNEVLLGAHFEGREKAGSRTLMDGRVVDEKMRLSSSDFKEVIEAKRAMDDNYVHLFEVHNRRFPIGLIDKVCSVLSEEGISVEIDDPREIPEREFDWEPRDNWLEKARDYQVEGVGYVHEHSRILYEWATNAGKTLLISLILAELGVKTLILTHSGILARQVKAAINDHLGVDCALMDGATVNKKGFELKPITIAVVNTARNHVEMLNEYGFKSIMVDEAHRSAALSYVKVVSRLDTYYMFGFTGTAKREGGDGIVLEAQYGTFRPNKTNREMIDAGYSCPVKIEVERVEVEVDKNDPWSLIYRNGIADNNAFNAKVLECILRHVRGGRQVVVQVAQKHQSKLLWLMLYENYKDEVKPLRVDGDYSAKRNYQRLEDFKLGRYNVAIGTVINEGFDCPTLDVVINAAGLKAESLLKQKLGRVFRIREGKEYGIYVDFYVSGHYVLERHSRQRLETLEREGFEIPLLRELRDKEAEEERQIEAKRELEKARLEELIREEEARLAAAGEAEAAKNVRKTLTKTSFDVAGRDDEIHLTMDVGA